MKTLRIVLALTIMLLIAMPAMAAQQKQQKKRRGAQLSPSARIMMTLTRLRSSWDALDLTEEQKGKAAKVREEIGPKMKEGFGKLREIITDEQATAIEEAMRKARDAGKKDRALVQAIDAAIKLTDQQKEQMAKPEKQLAGLQRQLMRKLRAILTDDQKAEFAKKMFPNRAKNAKNRAAKKRAAAKKAAE